MSSWKVLGEYLGREVRIARFSECLTLDQLDDSLVLVVFGDEFVSDEKGYRLLDSLAQRQPLAITVCGAGARKAFDLLIAILSDGRELKQIMTKYFDGEQIESAVEDFLHSTWPSEDRFGEWSKYAIVIVGNSDPEIEKAIGGFCD